MYREGGVRRRGRRRELRQDPRPAPPARRDEYARRHGAQEIARRHAAPRRRRHRLRVRPDDPSARGAGRRTPTGSTTSTCWSTSTRRRWRCRSGVPPRSRSRCRAGVPRRPPVGIEGMWERVRAVVPRRAGCAARTLGRCGGPLGGDVRGRWWPRFPGFALLVDTGHVADWGGDPLELLEFAGHVQLRQGARGRDPAPRRRPRRCRRLRRGRPAARRSRVRRAALRRVLRPARTTAGPWPIPERGPSTSPLTSRVVRVRSVPNGEGES